MSDHHETEQSTMFLHHISPKLLALNFNSILLTGIVLIVFWPKRQLFDYIDMQHIPILFPGMFISALIIMSYNDLCYGAGELIEEPKYPYLLGRRVFPFEKQYKFFPKSVMQFALYSLFSLMLLLPVLLVSAAVSKISFLTCAQALSILYATSFLFRLVGLFSFLLFGPQHILGFFLTRICFIVFMAFTAIFVRLINPIYLLLLLYQEGYQTLTLSTRIYIMYIMMVFFGILLFTLFDHMMITRIQQKKEKWTQNPVL